MDVTQRTRVRRAAKRASYDRATVEAILDEALVDARLEPGVGLPAHVAALRDRFSRAMR